eukprot:12919415-Prorocentrum_lima.AAC.1
MRVGYRHLEEQNAQARLLIESISGHVRDQQRVQDNNLKVLNEEYHRVQYNSERSVGVLEERTASLQ